MCMCNRCIVVKANLHHNHELPNTVAESMPYTSGHHIPKEFQQFAEELQGFRLAGDIHKLLVRMATKRGIPISWNERYIRNHYGMATKASHWQVNDFLSRLALDGRAYTYTYNKDDGLVDTVIWLMDGGDGDLLYHASQVAIFDNTFNTNSLGLKLGLLTTVDRFGLTRLVGCSLMLHETREAFAHVLASFQKLGGILFTVLLTDGDLWLGEAIQLVCDSCVHLLCTWHLGRNIFKNVRRVFASRVGNNDWNTFLRMWWAICLKSDSTSCSHFDSEWGSLHEFILTHTNDPDAEVVQDALKYLGGPRTLDPDEPELSPDPDEPQLSPESPQPPEPAEPAEPPEPQELQPAQDDQDGAELQGDEPHEEEAESRSPRYFNIYALRRKWAARWTSSVFTHGAASTQRGESMFSCLKAQIVGGLTLDELYDQLHSLVDQKKASAVEKVVRASLHQSQHLMQSPLIVSLQSRGCSPFLLSVAAAQVSRAAMYVHEACEPSGDAPSVTTWRVWHHTASVPLPFQPGDEQTTHAELQMEPEFDLSGIASPPTSHSLLYWRFPHSQSPSAYVPQVT